MDVKTLCLGVLSRGPASGYEIRKQFEEGPFAHFQEAGFGSIYPSLRKLLEEGLAQEAEPDPDGRPEKKIYRITSAGRQVLYDALMRPPSEDRVRSDFLFVMFFAHLLPPRHVDALVEARIAAYRRCLADMDQRRPLTSAERFVQNFGRAVYSAALQYLEEHRHELVSAALLDPKVAE
ncbi:MAG TPA: PadR family transcriptional regulator [Azospirillaceae bacterium]|nr:PadR family transcriptional regulator [Azospirillaceae bacterium]